MDEVTCPRCDRMWTIDTEQAVAIKKRRKCIVCIIELKENIKMDPYEFEREVLQGDGK